MRFTISKLKAQIEETNQTLTDIGSEYRVRERPRCGMQGVDRVLAGVAGGGCSYIGLGTSRECSDALDIWLLAETQQIAVNQQHDTAPVTVRANAASKQKTRIKIGQKFELTRAGRVDTFIRLADDPAPAFESERIQIRHLSSSLDDSMKAYTFGTEPQWFTERGLIADCPADTLAKNA